MSIWPWSDVVSYIHRYTDISRRKEANVLELGCGAGANIPFFDSLGVNYYGMDGSEYVIQILKEKFPNYAKKLKVGDFSERVPFDITFDVVFDRAALTHNSTDGILKTLQNIYPLLASNGAYIGIDWFSTKHDDFTLGEYYDDFTKVMKNIPGQFHELGKVHFSSKEHLLELFKDFHMKVMEEKIIETVLPKKQCFSSWNFVAYR